MNVATANTAIKIGCNIFMLMYYTNAQFNFLSNAVPPNIDSQLNNDNSWTVIYGHQDQDPNLSPLSKLSQLSQSWSWTTGIKTTLLKQRSVGGMVEINLLSSTFLVEGVLMMGVAICGVGLNTASIFHFAQVTSLKI